VLVDFLRANRDIFVWKPSDMLGIPREVNERAFLLGGEGGADAHRLVGGVVEVDEDLLDVLHRLEGSGHPLYVGRSFGDVLPDGCELLRS